MPDQNPDRPIFERGTKAQKAVKPAIEDTCDYFLRDETLKKGMARLIELSRELKMKPCWVQINGYKCSYKGKGVVSYEIGGNNYTKDYLKIGLSLAEREDLERVVLALPGDLREELLSKAGNRVTHCRVCHAPSCGYGGSAAEIDGRKHYLCYRFTYMRRNPTPEQFETIERFIKIRRDYIDGK